jgi:hypothetical protein
VADHNRYTMRDHSYRTTLALTRLHQRLLTPTLEWSRCRRPARTKIEVEAHVGAQ